jgi:ABC-type glycerol-3-phosphate transport system permease component
VTVPVRGDLKVDYRLRVLPGASVRLLVKALTNQESDAMELTLPVVLNQYVGVYQQQYGVFLAGTLLAIIPPAILFFALQKEFISGLTSGAVKG